MVIPVRDEAATLGGVIASLQALGLKRIRVVDNGSSDRSAIIAQQAGAEVVFESIAGYGQACWRGLQDLPQDIEWILFCDGDGSDDLSQIPVFLQHRDIYDLILGDRTGTVTSRRALTPVQRFGNRLSGFLIHWGWGYPYRDLGPLRLIRRSALESLQMQDRGFGWTVEMQVKAVECNLRICEMPVNYRPRQGGKSKISGTISGSIQAGIIILTTLARLYWQKTPKTPHLSLSFLSGIFLLLGTLLILPYGDFRQVEALPRFCWGIGVMGIGFVLSWRLQVITKWWFWTVAILARLLLLPMYPSDDVWRYLWEGYIQTQGFSPYHFAPNAIELLPYRTQWWSLMNHPDVSAIYPPLAQWGFRGLAAISPSVFLFKVAFIGADLLICWLLSRRYGEIKTLLYAWNPLVIYSFAGGAHYDSWFILPLVAAGLVWEAGEGRRQEEAGGLFPLPFTPSPFPFFISSLLLGISIAMKWMSLPILSFLLWQAWRQVGLKLAVIVAFCAFVPVALTAIPFCSAAECPLIPTSSNFVSHGRSAELLPHLIAFVWEGSRQANWIYAIPLVLGIIWLLWKVKSFIQFTEGYFFILLVISPIIHAWYFSWMVPFAVKTQNLGVRLVSLSTFIYFVLKYRQASGDTSWYLSNGERFLLWFPFVLGWLWTQKIVRDRKVLDS